MKNGTFQKLLPHIIAVIVFLIVAVIYCKPTLQGEVVNQHDVTHWEGAMKQSLEVEEKYGEKPLWTNALFSGMPTFQIGYPSNAYVPWTVHNILSLYLPKPIQFFFLACVCFYFLCIVLKINPYAGIFGALSFAYATYNPVIVSVGHDTKMWSIAYMPALLASILLVYERKYWLGAGLTALFTSVMIAMNHPQIAYYFFIAVAIMSIFYIVRWVKQGEMKHMIMALSFTLVAGLIGLLTNAVSILSTYEYQKETIRGGASELAAGSDHSKTGLDKDYALSYSMAIPEPFVMFIPKMMGGSSSQDERGEDSKTIEVLQTFPAELQQQLPVSYYWGGMTSPGEAGVSGPAYVGAIICFLAILGMFVLDNKHKWWMFTTIILTIMMSWGKFFIDFNSFLYHYLPLYNKFRAPSMILVVPQLLLGVLAIMTINKIAFTEERKELWSNIKKGVIATGAVFLVALMIYWSSDFISGNDKNIIQSVRDSGQAQLVQLIDSFYDAMKEDRQALMMGSIGRSFVFVLIALGIVYLLYKRTLKPIVAFIGLSLLTLIDLMPINATYLNSENYEEPSDNQAVFQTTQADQAIMADTGYYRVMNFAGNAFSENITSYHYNSVGGYHPAKIRIYQDLIEHQLSKQQPNFAVLNMLNTKYLIQKDPRTGLTQNYQRNDSALGHAWFVKAVKTVKTPAEEMSSLNNFHPRDTAVVQEQFLSRLPGLPSSLSGEGAIQLVSNRNDVATYRSNSPTPGLAVFSEVFYDAGWKAFVDGKETPIGKVNYVLRALSLPAGNHEIVFRFEPQGFITGHMLTTIFQIILVLVLAAGIFLEWRKNRAPVPKK